MPQPTAMQRQHARQSHIGRLLLNAYRDFNARALALLRERGYASLTPAHLNLIPHLDLLGSRINVVAERAELTKQAAGQLVGELEKYGYVVRSPDPVDKRATQIRFTAQGEQLLEDAAQIKRQIEQEYRSKLGEEAWEALQHALGLLVAK